VFCQRARNRLKTKDLTFWATTKSAQEIDDKGDEQSKREENRGACRPWLAGEAVFAYSQANITPVG
jgi:hypothetical protein